MTRVTLTLQNAERYALIALAQRERRDPRAQAALIIRRKLERLGFVFSESEKLEVKNETERPATA